jgi:N-acetylgalactosamine kinase
LYQHTEFKKAFQQAFPDAGAPTVCQAPGRVNLIGEHLDYNGLPVLPMTIDRHILIAFAPRSDCRIRMQNVDSAFPALEFQNAAEIPPSAPGSWDNYCKAALAGLNAHFAPSQFVGMDMLVEGNIPIAAGLSSSSALVVACALAYLSCVGDELGEAVTNLELASLLADAEHYVGTRGGGMDHAIILFGEPDQACRIDFFPLRVEKLPLFPDHVFVVCHTLVRVEKSANARNRYNEGPLVCSLVRALVERAARQQFSEHLTLNRLGDLWHGHLCLTHDEVAALFADALPPKNLTIEDIARTLGTTPDDISRRWLGDLKPPENGFPLWRRARHQLTEYQRVEAARDALLAGEALAFAELMNASHQSCACDYDISCPELDALVDIAREAGAMGSRLTGAGLGGCTVSLVPANVQDAFIDRVDSRYYKEYLGLQSDALPGDRILVARAGSGAGCV